MRLITLAAASVNQTPLAWKRNLRHITSAIEDARAQGAEIVCLPELCITGYGSEDLFLSRWYIAKAWSVLAELLPLSKGLIVGCGIPVVVRNTLYNGYAICVDGALAGVVAKQHLAGDGVHYEYRWFKPWREGVTVELAEDYLPAELLGVPVGDIVFSIDGVRLAVEICEDSWVPNRPLRQAALSGVDIVMSPSASHFALGKWAERAAILREGARFSSAVVLSANLLGCESGKMIFDGDARILNGEGTVAQAHRFSLKRYEVVSATIDIDVGRTKQQSTASLQSDPNPKSREVRISGIFSSDTVARYPSRPALSAEIAESPFEELWRAITLGLLDYGEKSGSRGFVISLSGGADSASVASLVYLMARRAIAEIGLSELLLRFRLDPTLSESEVMRALLACVYQKTVNSSFATEDAARDLAESIGCAFRVFEIQPLVDLYQALTQSFIGRELTWESDDTTLQNIQARVRSPSVWMLANIRGALLLTTGNRSELSVGYATMDGDMSGGLNPIGGIDKPLLLKFLRWLANEGPAGYGPLQGLEKIVSTPPTAELRPISAAQTDEADLMPYEILQEIESAFVHYRRSPDEVAALLEAAHPEDPMREWVNRYFTLFLRNQWKRERAAPSFHLDRYSLDPRSWMRFPILAGEEVEE